MAGGVLSKLKTLLITFTQTKIHFSVLGVQNSSVHFLVNG